MVGGGIIVLLNASTGILTARAILPGGARQPGGDHAVAFLLAYIASLGMPPRSFTSCAAAKRIAGLIPTGLIATLLLGCIAAVGGMFFLPLWLHNYSHEVIRAARFAW